MYLKESVRRKIPSWAPLVSEAGTIYLITLCEHWEELQSQGHTQRSQSSVFLTVLYRSELGKYIGTPISPHLTIFIHQQPELELKFHNLNLMQDQHPENQLTFPSIKVISSLKFTFYINNFL